MRVFEFLLIIFFSAFTGWFISWLIIKILFWPVRPIHFPGFKIQGLIPASRERIAGSAGKLIQKEFSEYKGLEEKVTDPALLAKLKPEIEAHVDHFLKEKLKLAFPLLSQFMGAKTLNQFKETFLLEIDSLFPVMMKNYIGELKNELRLDIIISQRMNSIPTEQIRDAFYSNAKKQIRYFKITCTVVGLAMGIISACLLCLM